jgi:hypothetical protein
MQKLPNSDLVLTMGICSIIGSLFCCGPFGGIFSIIGLVNAKKAERLYKANPEAYMGYNNVNTGRILSWIGLVIAAIMLVFFILYFGFIIAVITGTQSLDSF